MYRPYKLLLACPWMNRQDLECNTCPYRDPPQLEITGYMRWKLNWWAFSLDTIWHANECAAMGRKKCFCAVEPWLRVQDSWNRFFEEIDKRDFNELRTSTSSH